MIMNGKLEIIWKKEAMTYFKALFLHFHTDWVKPRKVLISDFRQSPFCYCCVHIHFAATIWVCPRGRNVFETVITEY